MEAQLLLRLLFAEKLMNQLCDRSDQEKTHKKKFRFFFSFSFYSQG